MSSDFNRLIIKEVTSPDLRVISFSFASALYFVGAGSLTIIAHNRQYNKPAPAHIFPMNWIGYNIAILNHL
jgi:hypothetical protein